MTRNAIQPDGVATPKAPYSPVVVSGDHVFTAGQVGFEANGDLVAVVWRSRCARPSRT
jgi:enamine deaminase RidA (YjgF/YER057c/UK114 family)